MKHLDSLVFQVAVGHGLGLGLVHFGPSLGLSLHDIDLVNISAVSLYFTAPLQHLNCGIVQCCMCVCVSQERLFDCVISTRSRHGCAGLIIPGMELIRLTRNSC